MPFLLFIQIHYKRLDIAILSAMGMPLSQIKRIFLLSGMLISSTATSTGLLGAFLAASILHNYIIITLPDAYFVSHLPVSLEYFIFVAIFITLMVISLIALWLPTQSIKKINISNTLRFES